MAKSKIDIIYDMVNLAYDVKRQWSKDKDSIWLGEYARAVIKAKDEKVYDKFVDLANQLETEGWDEFINACKYLIDEYNQIEESKKSMKESINGDCYIYFDDNGEIYGKKRRWVFCDNVKGITNTRDFFPLNDFIIDAIHIFKNEKQAQKFIDVDCKYFEDKNKLIIAEYPQTVSGFFESKESATKSIRESKVMTFEEFKKLCNNNFGYAIMDFNEYKGAYIVVVSSNEKATELFTKALRKKGLECTFYELKDPNSEYYRCYEIMCV